jgi:hypothetical protein
LLDGGFVAIEAQGRHRYVRLAGPEVADLLEAVGNLAPAATTALGPPADRVPAALAFARSCYDHLAGELGVRLYERLVASGCIGVVDDHPVVASGAAAVLAPLEIDVAALARARRPVARHCLDWTERRYHLAGSLGAALLAAMLERRWLVRDPRPRTVRLTAVGRTGLADQLGLALP